MKEIKLDPNIEPIILKFNAMGYKTLFSCAGNHKDVSKFEYRKRGYIVFKGTLDLESIKKVGKDLGLRYV